MDVSLAHGFILGSVKAVGPWVPFGFRKGGYDKEEGDEGIANQEVLSADDTREQGNNTY